MKRLFVLIAAIPFVINAQETKEETNRNISVGFSFSPEYNYRALKNNDGSSSSDMVIDIRNDMEKGKLGFTSGLNLNVRLSKKMELQTGLLYSNKGYKIPKRAADYPISDPAEPTHIKLRTSVNYLEAPVKLNFISGKHKVRLIAGAGIVAGIFLRTSTKSTLFYSDGREEKRKQSSSEGYNTFNLSSSASVGLEYKLSDNICLRAEPTFRYGLTNTNDKFIAEHLWNVGLNMSIYVQLKNLK